MIARVSILCAMLAVLIGAGDLAAQSEPAELTAARTAFEQKFRTRTSTLNDQFARALAPIEAELAAAGDYENAQAVKARRDALQALIDAAPAVTTGPAAIPLTHDSARYFGGVTAQTNGVLAGWRSVSCAAEWSPRVPPGNYRLQFSYTMENRSPEPGSAASARVLEPVEVAGFGFREVSSLASASRNLRSFKLEKTQADKTATITVDPPLDLTKPPFTLRLYPLGAYSANVITISDIKLVPVTANTGAVAETSGSATSVAGDLDLLIKTYPQRLSVARKPVITEYLTNLGKLVPNGDDDSAIEAEQRRVQKLIDTLASRSSNGVQLDNFEEVSGARFVPDPSNSGDRFKVEQGGKQFFVRLAWVACPPVDPNDMRTSKFVAGKFGCEETLLPSLALSAKEFTAFYLEGRTLNLLLRRSKKVEDAAIALVLLEDIGLYQGVLVDHGLAVVDPPNSASKGGMESSFLSGLMERENAARKQKPSPGGWNLKTAP